MVLCERPSETNFRREMEADEFKLWCPDGLCLNNTNTKKYKSHYFVDEKAIYRKREMIKQRLSCKLKEVFKLWKNKWYICY